MMKKLALALVALLGLSMSVMAQTPPSANGTQYNPNWTTGYILTAPEWGRLWSNKLDYTAAGLPLIFGGTGGTTHGLYRDDLQGGGRDTGRRDETLRRLAQRAVRYWRRCWTA